MSLVHEGLELTAELAQEVLVPLLNEKLSKAVFKKELTKRLQQRGLILPDLLSRGDVLIDSYGEGYRMVTRVVDGQVYYIELDDWQVEPEILRTAEFNLSETNEVGHCSLSCINKEFAFYFEY